MENQEMQNLSAPSTVDSPETTLDATKLDIAKLGYETAIQLWAAEIQNQMSEYNAMLVANSLILAAVGFSYQTISFSPIIKYVLPVAGIVICLAWYMSCKRAIEKAILWLYCAREIEGKFFTDVFKHLYNGYVFSRGHTMEFLLEGKIRSRRMEFWGRQVKNQLLFNFIILVFVIIYAFILLIELV